MVQQDLKTLRLTTMDAEGRDQWRRRTRVAEPSPKRD